MWLPLVLQPQRVKVTKDNEDADDDSEEENPPADFDPYLKPQFWYINASLFPKRTKDAH